MNLENLDATALLAIVLVVFAVLGFIKTAVSIFFTFIALAAGALAAIWGYNNGFTIASYVVDHVEPWMATVVAAIAFAGAYTLVKKFLNLLIGRGGEGSQARTLGFGLPGLLLGLGTGSTLLYGLLSGIRYGGTIAELGHLQDYVTGKIQQSADSPALARLKQWVDNSTVGRLHQHIDLFNDQREAQLAKIAVVKQDEEIARAIVVEEPEIKHALPVNDQEIDNSIRTGDFTALLRKARELGIGVETERLIRLNIEHELGLKQ